MSLEVAGWRVQAAPLPAASSSSLPWRNPQRELTPMGPGTFLRAYRYLQQQNQWCRQDMNNLPIKLLPCAAEAHKEPPTSHPSRTQSYLRAA